LNTLQKILKSFWKNFASKIVQKFIL